MRCRASKPRRELVKVITAEECRPRSRETAGDVLSKRKTIPKITALVVSALQQSYDHLEDKRPRGLDAFAGGDGASIKEAVPVAARAAADREPRRQQRLKMWCCTGMTKRWAAAKTRLVPLRNTLLVYRADHRFASIPMLLQRTGEGLLALGGEPGAATASVCVDGTRARCRVYRPTFAKCSTIARDAQSSQTDPRPNSFYASGFPTPSFRFTIRTIACTVFPPNKACAGFRRYGCPAGGVHCAEESSSRRPVSGSG